MSRCTSPLSLIFSSSSNGTYHFANLVLPWRFCTRMNRICIQSNRIRLALRLADIYLCCTILQMKGKSCRVTQMHCFQSIFGSASPKRAVPPELTRTSDHVYERDMNLCRALVEYVLFATDIVNNVDRLIKTIIHLFYSQYSLTFFFKRYFFK